MTGDNDPLLFMPTGEYRIAATPDPFAKLPALAERLGVEPGKGTSGFWVQIQDGRRYDVFAIVEAVLDRLDKAAP